MEYIYPKSRFSKNLKSLAVPEATIAEAIWKFGRLLPSAKAQLLAGGFMNANFLVSDQKSRFVFRVSSNGSYAAQVERDLLQFLYPRGVRVPEIYGAVEAGESTVTALDAAGIYAIVNNEVIGSIMPHASNAFGGFHVSMDAEKEAEARSLLEGATPEEKLSEEPLSLAHQVDNMMKRGAYGAMMACSFLPVIANLFSLGMYWRAYRKKQHGILEAQVAHLHGRIFQHAGISDRMAADGYVEPLRARLGNLGELFSWLEKDPKQLFLPA